MTANPLILLLNPGPLVIPGAVPFLWIASCQENRIEEFRPSLGLGFYKVHAMLMVIQARRMLEFMEQDTGRIFCSVDHDGVRSAGIGISSVDVFGLDGRSGGRRELPRD
jgi:hypothetical protein